jgi:hypothetical protein
LIPSGYRKEIELSIAQKPWRCHKQKTKCQK